MGRLTGKVALITGGGAGIGAACVERFVKEGAAVVIAEIDAVRGERVAAATGALLVRTDVTRESDVRAAVEATLSHRGRIDILVNVAGGSAYEDGPVDEVDLALFGTTMNLNVLGTMLACRHVVPSMIASGGGSIVNLSSGAALRGGSPKHIYTAAKGAIVSLTRTLAGSYARHGIRANAICAGRILTERILDSVGRPGAPGPLADKQDAAGRVRDYPFWVGQPTDIANIALFLAADESRMITGASIAADGGRSAY